MPHVRALLVGPPERERLDTLTAREREVLGQLWPPGASNKDIAEYLGISALTVKAHVRRILAKLGVPDRGAAAPAAAHLARADADRQRATG